MRPRFSFDAFRRVIVGEQSDSERHRVLIHQLPREFHGLSRREQAAALADPPALTGERRWDAFLAAIAEHVARLHDHPVPAWVDEPERFLDLPWVLARTRIIGHDSVLFAPGAFIRHSVLPDPLDLDARGGEKHEWIP